MNTCANCEWWDTRGYLPQLRRSPDNQKIQVGNCTVLYGFPHPTPVTWADFSCPHFKPRADWADRAAEEITHPPLDGSWTWLAMGGTSSSEILPKFQKHIAGVIRKYHEEAAKAGVK